jgi:CRISPR-associated endonuclease/helicase Cas3
MRQAMTLGDTSTRRDLIRDSSASRTLLVHPNPEKIENPFRYRGFSIFVGSLLGKYEQLEAWANERGLEWIFKFPQEAEDWEEDDSRAKIKYLWRAIRSKEDLKFFPLLVVNPALVQYDDEIGFRFSPNDDPPRDDLNNPAVSPSKSRNTFDYQLEDYPTHVQKMIRVFEREWRDRLQFAAARLEQAQGWPDGSVERAARLAIALHDVGKMDTRWQKWAREYQKAIGEPIADPNFMIVHTHSETEAHRQIGKTIRPKRPHHAGEGAVAVAKLLNEYFSQWPEAREGLRRVTLTAIARHHSAQASSYDTEYTLENAAQEAIFSAIQNAGIDISPAAANNLFLRAPALSLENQVPKNGNQWLAYFLVVRALRMCDGESQEEG